MTVFFGFALADSMFEGDVTISRRSLTLSEVKQYLDADIVSCCNPSHEATISAMYSRFGIEVDIPDSPPRVNLHPGDSVIVMGVRGLPHLTDRHEYTDREIQLADFRFSIYVVSE